MRVEEKILLYEIKKRNKKVFEALFYDYYAHLVHYAERFVFDRGVSEDIVQNLFIYFWENNHLITIQSSLKAYFYQSVKNRCLNYLRDLRIKDKYNLLFLEASIESDDAVFWDNTELTEQIQKAIESLPQQMRDVFLMKYLNGSKIEQIADVKGISANTIKTQLQRARKRLREKLTEQTT